MSIFTEPAGGFPDPRVTVIGEVALYRRGRTEYLTAEQRQTLAVLVAAGPEGLSDEQLAAELGVGLPELPQISWVLLADWPGFRELPVRSDNGRRWLDLPPEAVDAWVWQDDVLPISVYDDRLGEAIDAFIRAGEFFPGVEPTPLIQAAVERLRETQRSVAESRQNPRRSPGEPEADVADGSEITSEPDTEPSDAAQDVDLRNNNAFTRYRVTVDIGPGATFGELSQVLADLDAVARVSAAWVWAERELLRRQDAGEDIGSELVLPDDGALRDYLPSIELLEYTNPVSAVIAGLAFVTRPFTRFIVAISNIGPDRAKGYAEADKIISETRTAEARAASETRIAEASAMADIEKTRAETRIAEAHAIEESRAIRAATQIQESKAYLLERLVVGATADGSLVTMTHLMQLIENAAFDAFFRTGEKEIAIGPETEGERQLQPT